MGVHTLQLERDVARRVGRLDPRYDGPVQDSLVDRPVVLFVDVDKDDGEFLLILPYDTQDHHPLRSAGACWPTAAVPAWVHFLRNSLSDLCLYPLNHPPKNATSLCSLLRLIIPSPAAARRQSETKCLFVRLSMTERHCKVMFARPQSYQSARGHVCGDWPTFH